MHIPRLTGKPEANALFSRLHQPRQHRSRHLVSVRRKLRGRPSSATFGGRVAPDPPDFDGKGVVQRENSKDGIFEHYFVAYRALTRANDHPHRDF